MPRRFSSRRPRGPTSRARISGKRRLESPGTGRRRTTTRSSEGWMMKFSNRRVDDPGDAARRGASPGGGETHLAERGGDAERRRGFQRALNHEHRVCASRATLDLCRRRQKSDASSRSFCSTDALFACLSLLERKNSQKTTFSIALASFQSSFVSNACSVLQKSMTVQPLGSLGIILSQRDALA